MRTAIATLILAALGTLAAPQACSAQTPQPAPAAAPLTLDEVLKSVNAHYPPLLAVMQERVLAAADVLSAEGRFDLAMRGNYDGGALGFYRNDVYRASVEQPFQWQGITAFTGYQLGRGDFPDYDGKLATDTAGQFRTGLRMPLLRDREIDSRRASLFKAYIGRRVADLAIDQQRLVITQMATNRYWDWVAAGRRFQAAESVLAVAEQRDQQLKDASDIGQIPRIDVVDNQRAILTRRNQVVEARRSLELTSIDLSLFLRDASGATILPDPARLPAALPDLEELSAQRFDQDLDAALARRPEIRRFAAQREQATVDRRLAENQKLPNADVVLAYTRNAGDRIIKRGPDEFTASLIFDLPLQRRQAKGAEIAANARISQLNQREQFARDQAVADVRDAYSAVKAAYNRALVLRQELEVARQLEEAERARFELGDGTLFLVNLREQATFDTAIREVSATNDYFKAWALYKFAIAEAVATTP